jgi:NADPH2:quinone reductase
MKLTNILSELPPQMSVVEGTGFGGPDVLRLATRPLPEFGTNQVLIKVAAAGINRADLMQRRGKYPPPPGASDILGMEVSGTIAATGPDASRWKVGDRVCALLAGGGYAEYVAVSENHCLPVPDSLSLTAAAALPEAMVTVYANVFEAGALLAHETALIHGGSSGIGTMAIQMAKQIGASVIATVGSAEKMETCYDLGADFVVNYTSEDFVIATLRATNQRGANMVLDMVGGDYISRNIEALAFKGRHVSIATQKGVRAEINLIPVMQKQLILTGSTLRGRIESEKARLIAELTKKFWPLVVAKKIKPVIYQTLPLKKASEAHKVMESGAQIGKIVLEVS